MEGWFRFEGEIIIRVANLLFVRVQILFFYLSLEHIEVHTAVDEIFCYEDS